MDDFEEGNKLWFLRNILNKLKNVRIPLQKLHKIYFHILLFQKIRSIFFYFEKKTCIFSFLRAPLSFIIAHHLHVKLNINSLSNYRSCFKENFLLYYTTLHRKKTFMLF